MKKGRKLPRKDVHPPKLMAQKNPDGAISVARRALKLALELPVTGQYKEVWEQDEVEVKDVEGGTGSPEREGG